MANGEKDAKSFSRSIVSNCDYIICCDGAISYLLAIGVIPDLLVGDMDSLDVNIIRALPKNMETARYSTQKDETDLELAVTAAISKNPSQIIVLGAFGGRIDHELGNIHQLIRTADAGIDAFLLSNNTKLYVTKNELCLRKEKYNLISLIPITTTVNGITTEGLNYALTNEDLKIGQTRGVSNTFISDIAKINVQSGYLLVICSKNSFKL